MALQFGFLCLLLCALTGCFCQQCREGAKYSDAIISPNLERTKIMRVPHALLMPDCMAACCDLSDCDLAWMFEQHCYIVNCQHKGNCEPKKMEKVKSYLTFVLRVSQRPTSLLGFQQMPSKALPSMTLQDDPSEEVRSLTELSFLSKEHSLEEVPDYMDEYGDMEQNPFSSNTKRENIDYVDWDLMVTTENGFNSSGDQHEELVRSDGEKVDLKSPTNKTVAEVKSVTEYPRELPDVALHPVEKTASNDSDFQPSEEANNSWQEKVLTPSHNPPSSDILGFLSTSATYVQTLDLSGHIEDETSSLPTSMLTSEPSATGQLPIPTTAAKAELLVSAGDNLQVTSPKKEVELHAFVVSPSFPEASYSYEWSLISHPDDYDGEMQGKYTQTLKLSQLPVGVYALKVTVSSENAFGEGFVNITVLPAVRINQPPIAVVSPRVQEIVFPTTSAIIDGDQSVDDTEIVSYYWEEIEGPLRKQKVSADTSVLHLSDLVPGNYTFRLTVVDSDEAANSTTASLIVLKPEDHPPVANAGANQVICLPQNSVTLSGNQSYDDHEIVSYEWSLSPKSRGKEVAMQGMQTPYLQLSAMQEGNYTFQLTVTDSVEQQSTAEVMVTVQPENRPPRAVAGPDQELTLPVQSTILDGSQSTDDLGIVYYHWENISGPNSLQMENVDSAVATVTSLKAGTYHFRLTVKDNQGLSSTTTLFVTVKEESNRPPQAYAGGKHILVLPNNSIALDGSQSSDDQGIVSYLWTRDGQSPAAGDVIHGSDHEAALQLTNLVEGIYTFHLKVTDGRGDSDTDTAVVEVQPDPKKNDLVELILQIGVGQLTEQQKDTLVRQLAVLLNVLESDIKVQKIHAYSDISGCVLRAERVSFQSHKGFRCGADAPLATLEREARFPAF
ncbi:dyslexia-associated protein KIAA0319 homolog isoform X2 [Sphaerodactylus townsendi]|uniref:dyslexia-associated protein KIAA0319 homolog isoform X2 n=1 Tax=Sphaerodactylus townsendi TaxID=933632 RepID=UPI00202714E6|nr:dyslexia-associated protein KIAA0319 homolog isoform X2 [Sphaerodactylus townsendi]XP_048364047.1 dyslexia-associated protein KIAA0319 homolog isoform X2 [Sphaerodactylus townsendi]